MNSNSRKFANNSRAGFTILELLIAMSLLAVIVSIVYMTFSTVIQSIEDARAASFKMRTRQFLTRSFSSNLQQTSEGWSPGSAYRSSTEVPVQENAAELGTGIGSAKYWLDGTSEKLTFVSTAPLAGNAALPGIIKLVNYELGEEEPEEDLLTNFGREPQATLEVTETPLALSGVSTGAGINLGASNAAKFTREDVMDAAETIGMQSVSWNIPIDAIAFTYYDGKNWVDKWDSLLQERMPWAIDIHINFPPDEESSETERDLEENPDFRLILTIPVGVGVYDPAPDYVRPRENARARELRQ